MAEELDLIKLGCLVKTSFYGIAIKETFVVTVKGVWSNQDFPGTCDCLFEETGDFLFWRRQNEISLVAHSLESVPLEDWAGLAHLLHPKLKMRVEEWLKKSI